MKKAIRLIKQIFVKILGIVFFAFAIIITILLLNYNKYGVTQIDNISLIKIKEDLSSDKYQKGDLVMVESKKIDKISIGDEVFVYKLDANGSVSVDIGVVGELHLNDNQISFKNGATYSMEFVIGGSTKIYNKIGTYLSIIESTWGFLFIVLVPSFLIFIYQLYALIIEIKYGREDNLSPQPQVLA